MAMSVEDMGRLARLGIRLARYEVKAQRRETFLGLVWIILWPLVQAAAFLLAFNIIRGTFSSLGFETILATYLGVLIWTTASSVLISNLGILKWNRELITQIVFPFSILSVVDVTVKYFFFLIQLVLGVAIWLVFVSSENWHIVLAYLPIYLLGFYFALVAMAWIASILGVALPDLSSFLPPVLILLLALSPVFQRDVEAIPVVIRLLNEINPFSLWVEEFYAILYLSGSAAAGRLLVFLAVSVAAVLAARYLVWLTYRELAKVV